MTRAECQAIADAARPALPHDEVNAAVLSTLLRIEALLAKANKPQPKRKTTRRRKPTADTRTGK